MTPILRYANLPESVMNVYDSFYMGMSPDEWEWFAADFLNDIGFDLLSPPSRGPDGGSDLIVSKEGVRYLVSCKHFLQSGKTVGRSDEESILERMMQHSVTGFIGFYSTFLSTGLQARINALKTEDRPILIYENSTISDHLPHLHAYVLQKYGLPNGVRYCLNVPVEEYSPLPCMRCSKDILQDGSISSSMALVSLDTEESLLYLYGCKACVGGYHDMGWTEVSQSLHPEQLNAWIKYVDDLLLQYPPAPDFHKNRGFYERRVLQRAFPSNWGQWMRM